MYWYTVLCLCSGRDFIPCRVLDRLRILLFRLSERASERQADRQAGAGERERGRERRGNTISMMQDSDMHCSAGREVRSDCRFPPMNCILWPLGSPLARALTEGLTNSLVSTTRRHHDTTRSSRSSPLLHTPPPRNSRKSSRHRFYKASLHPSSWTVATNDGMTISHHLDRDPTKGKGRATFKVHKACSAPIQRYGSSHTTPHRTAPHHTGSFLLLLLLSPQPPVPPPTGPSNLSSSLTPRRQSSSPSQPYP